MILVLRFGQGGGALGLNLIHFAIAKGLHCNKTVAN
jgi:hypothetical protein